MTQYITTLEAGTDKFCSVYYSDEKYVSERTRALLKMPIHASALARVPSAAVLSLYTEQSDNGSALSLSMMATLASWNGTSTPAQIEALVLSDALDTQSVAHTGNWTHWNVLGDPGRGVLKACADSSPYLTFVLPYGYGATDRQENLRIGSADLFAGDYRIFGFPGDGLTPNHSPILTITIDESGPVVHSGLGGGALMF